MLEDFDKVNDTVTVYRFHNGWMVEVSGHSSDDEWITRKIVCKDLVEVEDLLNAHSALPLT